MQIVSAADERFAAHFATMLHSAWTQHPTAQFHLLDCGVEPSTLAALSAFAIEQGIRLKIIKIDITLLRDLPTNSRWSVAIYARLLIPDILSATIDRALYIDADCLVVGDLTALWQIGIGEAAIAGVSDPGAHYEHEIGIEIDEHEYTNSGVLLMNLTAWRRYRLTAAAIAFIQHHRPRLPDQTGINAVCAGRIMRIATEWNVLLNDIKRPEQWLVPRIVHCTSAIKPWLYRDALFASIYLYHRNQTPFRIKPPAAHRSRLRSTLNLALGRRKYWDRLKLARCCDAFTSAYFDRLPRRVATSAPASEVRNTPQHSLIRTSET
jgi:lipopolysaccharide biosynthesis glycosyltransferase